VAGTGGTAAVAVAASNLGGGSVGDDGGRMDGIGDRGRGASDRGEGGKGGMILIVIRLTLENKLEIN
jgi:hypothetical protein